MTERRSPPPMRRHLFRIILLTALVLTAAALPFVSFLLRPVAPPAAVRIAIPAGTPFVTTAGRLEEQGVVASARNLRLLARLRGDAHRVQAGEYLFAEAATPAQVLDRLIAGDVVRLRVTIPEGYTVREIAAILAEAGFEGAETFLELARDRDFLHALDIEAPSLEGYIFPETYEFAAGIPAERLARAMVRQLRTRLTPEILAGAQERGLDVHQLLTLASIIQKEAGNREEMPLISAVFHNRLKKRMPLQADPTVIYGIENFDGNLTRRHLREKTPYNTYRIPALPPGPIASPGEDALRAAAFPAPVDYLYFVSRGDGTHVFSRTLEEHNRAVRLHQIQRSRK